jgi:hypothetical protein
MGAAVKYRTRQFWHWLFGINACYLIMLGVYQNSIWMFTLGILSLALELAIPPRRPPPSDKEHP